MAYIFTSVPWQYTLSEVQKRLSNFKMQINYASSAIQTPARILILMNNESMVQVPTKLIQGLQGYNPFNVCLCGSENMVKGATNAGCIGQGMIPKLEDDVHIDYWVVEFVIRWTPFFCTKDFDGFLSSTNDKPFVDTPALKALSFTKSKASFSNHVFVVAVLIKDMVRFS